MSYLIKITRSRHKSLLHDLMVGFLINFMVVLIIYYNHDPVLFINFENQNETLVEVNPFIILEGFFKIFKMICIRFQDH